MLIDKQFPGIYCEPYYGGGAPIRIVSRNIGYGENSCDLVARITRMQELSKCISIDVNAAAFDAAMKLLSQLHVNKIHFIISDTESFDALLKILKLYQWKNITITYDQYSLWRHSEQLAEIIKSFAEIIKPFATVEKIAIKAKHLSSNDFRTLYNAINATRCIKKTKFQMSSSALRCIVPPARSSLRLIISLNDITSPRCLEHLYKTNIYGIELRISDGIAIPNLLKHIHKLQWCRQLSIIHRSRKFPISIAEQLPLNIYCLKLNSDLSESLFITILHTHIEQIKRCKDSMAKRFIPATDAALKVLTSSTMLQHCGDYLNYDAPVVLKQLLDRNKRMSKRHAHARILDLVMVFNNILPIYVIVDIFDWLDHYHDYIAPVVKVSWALKVKAICDQMIR